MEKQINTTKDWIGYYEDRDILDEIADESVDLSLDERLRQDILSGKRKRKLKNITIKIDELVKSLFTCHCEESFGYAQDKLHDEAIS